MAEAKKTPTKKPSKATKVTGVKRGPMDKPKLRKLEPKEGKKK